MRAPREPVVDSLNQVTVPVNRHQPALGTVYVFDPDQPVTSSTSVVWSVICVQVPVGTDWAVVCSTLSRIFERPSEYCQLEPSQRCSNPAAFSWYWPV